MTTPPSLILGSWPGGALSFVPHATPGAVFVVTRRNGDCDSLAARPGWGERCKASRVYLVDTRDRRSTALFHLPAKGDVYHFPTQVEAGWRVVEPEQIVRHGLTNPDGLVMGYVEHGFRRMSRLFPPDAAWDAEEALARTFPKPVVVGWGLELLTVGVRVQLDERLVQRRLADDSNKFEVQQDQHRLAQQRGRIEHLKELVGGPADALFVHIAEHPDETERILQLIVQTSERDQRGRLELLDRLVDKGFVVEEDVAPLRERVLGLPTTGTWSGRWQVQEHRMSAAALAVTSAAASNGGRADGGGQEGVSAPKEPVVAAEIVPETIEPVITAAALTETIEPVVTAEVLTETTDPVRSGDQGEAAAPPEEEAKESGREMRVAADLGEPT